MSKYRNVEISIHKPVLLKELKALLNLKRGDKAVDATLGGGGHAEMMLKLVGPKGGILGIDQDREILKKAPSKKNLILALGNFGNIDEIAERHGFKKVKAILFDLGLSTWHLKESGRGFSFRKLEEPLDMRLGEASSTAAEILNSFNEDLLAKIFLKYGEEPRSRSLAKKIVRGRKTKRIISVKDLLDAIGPQNRKTLARIFQALRIEINQELEALEKTLPKSLALLLPNGRLAVISYHSLEDRIVKNFFSAKSGEAKIITKKPIIPSHDEILINPSSRSAKLRVLEKTK